MSTAVMNLERAAKIAAGRLGITVEEYQERRERGEKWCYDCRTFHPREAFNRDQSRRDGLANICRTVNRGRQPKKAARSEHELPPFNEDMSLDEWVAQFPLEAFQAKLEFYEILVTVNQHRAAALRDIIEAITALRRESEPCR